MKQLTVAQLNELYGFSYDVLSVKPLISEKELYKKMIRYGKSKKIPIKAVKKIIKDGETK